MIFDFKTTYSYVSFYYGNSSNGSKVKFIGRNNTTVGEKLLSNLSVGEVAFMEFSATEIVRMDVEVHTNRKVLFDNFTFRP
ncbi:hypothetical protein D3C71_1868230 [compost metagenome]